MKSLTLLLGLLLSSWTIGNADIVEDISGGSDVGPGDGFGFTCSYYIEGTPLFLAAGDNDLECVENVTVDQVNTVMMEMSTNFEAINSSVYIQQVDAVSDGSSSRRQLGLTAAGILKYCTFVNGRCNGRRRRRLEGSRRHLAFCPYDNLDQRQLSSIEETLETHRDLSSDNLAQLVYNRLLEINRDIYSNVVCLCIRCGDGEPICSSNTDAPEACTSITSSDMPIEEFDGNNNVEG